MKNYELQTQIEANVIFKSRAQNMAEHGNVPDEDKPDHDKAEKRRRAEERLEAKALAKELGLPFDD